MPSTQTPLRYPGGKSQLKWLVREMISEVCPRTSAYAEPYCGGAGIAVDLLLGGGMSRIYLNDADRGIASFWFAVKNEPDRLIDEIMSADVSVDKWLEVREERKRILSRNGDTACDDDFYSFRLAFLTFYLNRTNVSGVIDGGCIGGMSQKGNYKIDCRFNKETLVKKVRRIAEQGDRISVSSEDGVRFFTDTLPKLLREDDLTPLDLFAYIDPPYVKQGRNLYFNSMDLDAHRALSDALKNWTCKYWFLSYDDNELIRELYKEFDRRLFSVRYSASSHDEALELGIFPEPFREFRGDLKEWVTI